MGRHQVMVFVGNGFDISVLGKYGEGITTSYSTFYSYFKYKYSDRKDNSLILQMEKAQTENAKGQNKDNWSDFEALLTEQLRQIGPKDRAEIEKLNADLGELQRAFSRFLNEVVDSNIIDQISKATTQVPQGKKSLAAYSLSEFLGDLSEEQYKINKFQNRVNNHDDLNFVFINFNFTALLDNYIYLDKETFEPSPYSTTTNNFVFLSNPKNYPNHNGHNNPYCRLTTEIFHPHGYQDIPKSLLFGTEPRNADGRKMPARDLRRTFIKSYWAQSELRYGKYFDETNLFIIYGCSLGESDNWWWRKIYNRLAEDGAELVIYNYGNDDENAVKDHFIKGCCIDLSDVNNINKAKENIFVINFGPEIKDKIIFLQLPGKEFN